MSDNTHPAEGTPRTYVITGVASGIGKTTAAILSAAGHRIVGVDVRDADVIADLSTAEGRSGLFSAVNEASEGHVDAIIAVAGIAAPAPITIRVNYFGAVATLETLRPLLLRSDAPRAAIVSSFSTLQDVDDAVVDACLAGDESSAVEAAEAAVARDGGMTLYASSKRAISRWVRRAAIRPEWAGAGIPVNAVGPGIVISPMTQPMLDDPEQRAGLLRMVPMPLHGPSDATAPGELLAWLTGPTNTHVTGQVIFVDGGADATLRPHDIFQ